MSRHESRLAYGQTAHDHRADDVQLPDHDICPHCYSILAEGARYCNMCGAQKGYVVVLNRVFGFLPVLVFGLILPISFILLVVMVGPFEFGFLITAIVLGMAALYAYSRLVSGPYWFHHTARMWLALKARR